MAEKKTSATTRTRNFATVVYPESAPDNWQEILSEQFVPAFISPLHDNDLNPTGEVKKPHYHVMIMFDSVKTREQAQDIFNLIGGVGCEIVQSLRGYARYLCHLDNPDKALNTSYVIVRFEQFDEITLTFIMINNTEHDGIIGFIDVTFILCLCQQQVIVVYLIDCQ